MSRFFSEKFASLTPYTPGEQPRERKFIKLNTNESPFPPSAKAVKAAAAASERLQLYSDPTCKALAEKVAERYEKRGYFCAGRSKSGRMRMRNLVRSVWAPRSSTA